MKYRKLSDVEYEFMELLWSSESELNFQDFKNHFMNKNWAEKTISTYLHNIVKKGFLKSRREGRTFYYEPAVSQKEYQKYLLNERLHTKVGSSIEGLIAAFCGMDNVSDEDLKKISQHLSELEEQLHRSDGR